MRLRTSRHTSESSRWFRRHHRCNVSAVDCPLQMVVAEAVTEVGSEDFAVTVSVTTDEVTLPLALVTMHRELPASALDTGDTVNTFEVTPL